MYKKMTIGLLLVISIANAEVSPITPSETPAPLEAAPQSPSPEANKPNAISPVPEASQKASVWSIGLNGAFTVASQSYYLSNGASLLQNDREAYAGALEVMRDCGDRLSFGVLLNESTYRYSDPKIANDSQFSALFVAKLYFTKNQDIHFWGSLGAGLSLLRLGTTSGAIGQYTSTTQATPIGVTVSPRIGIDFLTSTGFFFGPNLAAYGSFFNTNATVTTPTEKIDTTVELTRTWFELGAHIGLRF